MKIQVIRRNEKRIEISEKIEIVTKKRIEIKKPSKKIIRVFPKLNKWIPFDKMCYYGSPDKFIPPYDEVHISCTFTWDLERCKVLHKRWQAFTDKPVLLGGPALDDPGGEFTPGMYQRKGITITSRGCPNKCKFCFVWKREGKLRELEIKPGNIIQDNNLLACSDRHINKVIEMLKYKIDVNFQGGLDTRLITQPFANAIRKLSITYIYLACDHPNAIKPLEKAVNIFKNAGFSTNTLRIYTLIGNDEKENEERLKAIRGLGCRPFAQLFQPEKRITYSIRWRRFYSFWCCPALHGSEIKPWKDCLEKLEY